MTQLSALELAYIHREAYAAIVRGCTVGGRGARSELARAAGITPQHLSWIVALDHQDKAPTERWPSSGVVERVCRHLPASPSLRQQAYEHMMMALQLRAGHDHQRTYGGPEATDRWVWDVRVLAAEATKAQAADEARRLYRMAREEGKKLLAALSPLSRPMDYMEICLCLHDVLGALDRHAEGLVYARLGDAVMRETGRGRLRLVEDRRRQVEVNLIRSLGVSYNSLGLPKMAMSHFERVRGTDDFRTQPRDWVAHVARDQLSAWTKSPRFAISEAESLAFEAEQRMADGQRGVVSILLRTKLAECFIAFGDRKGRAGKLLEPIIEKAEGAPMGMLHRVMVYRSYALYCRSQGDTVGLETWGSRALALAEESGLEHQARTIQSDVLGREASR